MYFQTFGSEKTLNSLQIHAVWLEYYQGTLWTAKNSKLKTFTGH